jgi:hypothetical protein
MVVISIVMMIKRHPKRALAVPPFPGNKLKHFPINLGNIDPEANSIINMGIMMVTRLSGAS